MVLKFRSKHSHEHPVASGEPCLSSKRAACAKAQEALEGSLEASGSAFQCWDPEGTRKSPRVKPEEPTVPPRSRTHKMSDKFCGLKDANLEIVFPKL